MGEERGEADVDMYAHRHGCCKCDQLQVKVELTSAQWNSARSSSTIDSTDKCQGPVSTRGP